METPNKDSLPLILVGKERYPLSHPRGLSRAISLVENESVGYENILTQLIPNAKTPIIGVTGAPGAGKSSLVDKLITAYTEKGKKVACLAIDPSSPFHQGSLLGDRIRMSGHFLHPNVFIRSVSTRGALGGLSAKSLEIADVLKSAGFDIIIFETVGVGQSEVEIASLADVTLVVLVPEGGDEVQALKSGLMEIADIFVVNKSDRPGSKEFIGILKKLLPQRSHEFGEIPICPTVAMKGEGIEELITAIDNELAHPKNEQRKLNLLLNKAWQIISYQKMKSIDRENLKMSLSTSIEKQDFNLYRFCKQYY